MRKYDTLIHSLGYGERRYNVLGSQPTIVGIRNSDSRKAVSLQPSLFVQGDIGMVEPHSLLTMCVSAERGRPATMISAEE